MIHPLTSSKKNVTSSAHILSGYMEKKAFTYRLFGFITVCMLLLQTGIPSVTFSARTPMDISEPSAQQMRSMQQGPITESRATDKCCKGSFHLEYQPSEGFSCKMDLPCTLNHCGATNSAKKAIITSKIPVDYISSPVESFQWRLQQYAVQSKKAPFSFSSSPVFLLNCVFLN